MPIIRECSLVLMAAAISVVIALIAGALTGVFTILFLSISVSRLSVMAKTSPVKTAAIYLLGVLSVSVILGKAVTALFILV